jgi:signal transduction histidine kinase
MPEPKPSAVSTPPADAGAFARRLLALTGEPLPRIDFIGRLARMLAEAVAGSPLELWADDGAWWIRARVDRGHPPDVTRSGPTVPNLNLDGVCAAAGIEPTGREPGRVVARRLPDGAHDVSVVEIAVGDVSAGWVVVDHGVEDYLARRDVGLISRVAEALATAVVTQRAHAALRERVKELSCLYDVAQLARRADRPLPDLLGAMAGQLPHAWQYPEIASAHIELDGRRFGPTLPLAAVVAEQDAPVVVDGVPRGRVVVGYHDARVELDEGPFLAEERSLLEAVATQVGAMVTRRESHEEHERLLEQLRHADRLATVGQLAAGVAHELNEPIGAVLGFAQLLRGQRAEADEDWEDLGKIESAALHARDIVRQLLLFSRRAPEVNEIVDLERVVDEAVVIVGPRLRGSGVRVNREPGTSPAHVSGDSAQLRQVLVNLLVNAVQAMPTGGDVTIRLSGRGPERVVEIEDTGEGMSEHVRQQALLPFFTTRQLHEGTGLGLAVVHGIVTAHGGTVEIDSREGRGTRVVLRLPVSFGTRES